MFHASKPASRQQDWDRRKFQSPDCPLQEVTFLVEKMISLFWMRRGQTGIPICYNRCLGWMSESRRLSTIGSDGWLLNFIVLHSSFLAGLFTGRTAVEALCQRMNFLTLLSLGLVIPIRGLERRGKRAKDWQSLSLIVEHY